jgi:hypothetical protein
MLSSVPFAEVWAVFACLLLPQGTRWHQVTLFSCMALSTSKMCNMVFLIFLLHRNYSACITHLLEQLMNVTGLVVQLGEMSEKSWKKNTSKEGVDATGGQTVWQNAFIVMRNMHVWSCLINPFWSCTREWFFWVQSNVHLTHLGCLEIVRGNWVSYGHARINILLLWLFCYF